MIAVDRCVPDATATQPVTWKDRWVWPRPSVAVFVDLPAQGRGEGTRLLGGSNRCDNRLVGRTQERPGALQYL
jgi:hypothetical protein